MKPRENPARTAPRHTLTVVAVSHRKCDSLHLSAHAERELVDLCCLYDLRRACLLRVLIECLLDAACDDPAWIAEVVDAARLVERGAPVPGCWLQEDDGDTEAADPEEDASFKLSARRHIVI